MTRTFTNNSATSRRIAEIHSKLGSNTKRFANSTVKYFAWNFESLPLITWIFVLGARWRLPGGAILFKFHCATARCLTENKNVSRNNSINSSPVQLKHTLYYVYDTFFLQFHLFSKSENKILNSLDTANASFQFCTNKILLQKYYQQFNRYNCYIKIKQQVH